jgi:hypothetical protein
VGADYGGEGTGETMKRWGVPAAGLLLLLFWFRSEIVDRLPRDVRLALGVAPQDVHSGNLGAFRGVALALDADGQLYGWGDNSENQLGTDSSAVHSPAPLAEGRYWRAVFAAGHATFAIDPDGVLYWRPYQRWGGDVPDPGFRPLFAEQRWRKALLAKGFGLGQTEDGRLWIWSDDIVDKPPGYEFFQLDDIQIPMTADRRLRHPDDAELDEKFRRFADDNAIGYAQRHEQFLSWAHTQPGGLDNPEVQQKLARFEAQEAEFRATLERRRAAYVAARSLQFPGAVAGAGAWRDVCFSREQLDALVYAVDDAGRLWRGKPARGPVLPTLELTPVVTPALQGDDAPRFMRLVCQWDSASAFLIEEAGELWGFGGNVAGTLGDGDGKHTGRNEPVPESGIKRLNQRRWALIAPAQETVAAINTDGALWAWGKGLGQFVGAESTISRIDRPFLLDDSREYVDVMAFSGAVIALADDGQLYQWDSEFGRDKDGRPRVDPLDRRSERRWGATLPRR